MTSIKQPKPKKGDVFYSWAVYNWGICIGNSFRTRREAQQNCVSSIMGDKCWNDVKDHYHIAKVKCIVE